MIPLVDTHCHLLAGLDDGPRQWDDAVAMCRQASEDGTRVIAATAHLGELWPESTPERIRQATQRLKSLLAEAEIPLAVYPSAEIMIRPGLVEAWERGELLGIAERTAYALLEFPLGLYFDIGDLVRQFIALGVHPVLAHPERQPELLHHSGQIEELIQLGCLVQVTAESVLKSGSRADSAALRCWFEREIVHLVASDGHCPRRRPPLLSQAHRQIARWVGADAADRLCGINGLIVLEGSDLRVPVPKPTRRRSFFGFMRQGLSSP